MAEITPSPQEQDHTNSAILSRTEASANTVITSDSDTIQSEPALDQQGSTSGGLIEEVEAEENAEGDGGEDGEEEEAEEEEDEEGSSELDEDRDIRVSLESYTGCVSYAALTGRIRRLLGWGAGEPDIHLIQ